MRGACVPPACLHMLTFERKASPFHRQNEGIGDANIAGNAAPHQTSRASVEPRRRNSGPKSPSTRCCQRLSCGGFTELLATSALDRREPNPNRQTSLGMSGCFWPTRRPLFQGVRKFPLSSVDIKILRARPLPPQHPQHGSQPLYRAAKTPSDALLSLRTACFDWPLLTRKESSDVNGRFRRKATLAIRKLCANCGH